MIVLPAYIVHKKCSRIILFVLLLVCVQRAAAQNNYSDTVAVPDTTVMVDSADIVDYESTDEEQEQTYIPDTPAFRKVPDSVVNVLKKDKAFEYANDAAYWSKENEEVPEYRKGFWDYFYEFFQQRAVRNVMYVLIGILFLFVIYRIIIQNNLYLSRASKKLKNEDEEDGIPEDAGNIDETIRKAIEAKDHRVAVRYLYIKLLHSLNDRGSIRYHSQATNHDYLLQMSGNRFAKEFSFLTEVYDYVWYGEFVLTEEQFSLVHTNFRNLFDALHY